MTSFISVAAGIFGIITIAAKLRGNIRVQFIFKPLAMTAIILLAFFNSSAPLGFYQKAVLAGLIFSMIGDCFLVLDEKFFVQGLVAFLLGHLCYITAFWTDPNWPSIIFYLVYIAVFLKLLWAGLDKLKIPVVVYASVLTVMSWMALSLTINHHDQQTFHAFLGSVIFIVSDSLLAYNKFRSKIPLAHLWILSTYFLAQWLIALSV